MQITPDIPDELAVTLALPGQDPVRSVLEAIGLEAYRQRRISAYQLRALRGISSRWDLDTFLKKHQVKRIQPKILSMISPATDEICEAEHRARSSLPVRDRSITLFRSEPWTYCSLSTVVCLCLTVGGGCARD